MHLRNGNDCQLVASNQPLPSKQSKQQDTWAVDTGMEGWPSRWGYTRATVQGLPFCTTFNRGHGAVYCQNGSPEHSSTWMNLSIQDPQPQWLQPGGGGRVATGVVARSHQPSTQCTDAPFEGDCCYNCTAHLPEGSAWQERLFSCTCAVLPSTLHISYSCTRALLPGCGVALAIVLQSTPTNILPGDTAMKQQALMAGLQTQRTNTGDMSACAPRAVKLLLAPSGCSEALRKIEDHVVSSAQHPSTGSASVALQKQATELLEPDETLVSLARQPPLRRVLW
jgi:hypothetical protein